MENKNVKWYQMTAQAVEEYLHTNASCGLSRKEARSRYRKVGANTLFDVPNEAFRAYRAFLYDPALLLLYFTCLLAICFFEPASGFAAVTVLICWGAILIKILVSAKQLHLETAKHRIPVVTVLRQGKKLCVTARSLVPGDIILLQGGDLVPADCRLISSRDLRVLTLYADRENRARYAEYPKSHEIHSQPMLIPNFAAYENMLCGGSELLEGQAMAIVVSTGKACLLAGIPDFVIPAERGTDKHCEHMAVRPFFKLYNLTLFALLIPLSIVSMLYMGESVGLLNLFLSLSAWVACSGMAILSLYLALPFLFGRMQQITADHRKPRMVLKSDRAERRLSEATELFVLGHNATSDGILHLYRCAVGNGEVVLTSQISNETTDSLCEAICLLRHAKEAQSLMNAEILFDPLAEVNRELLAYSEFDAEALAMRLLGCTVSAEKEDALLLDVRLKSGDFRLLFSRDHHLIDRCTFFEKDHRTAVFSSAQREELYRFYHSVREEAATPVIIIRQVGKQMIFLGILALRERLCTNVREILGELQKNGVRVTFFLNGDYETEARYMKMLGLSEPVRIEKASAFTVEQLRRTRVVFGMKSELISEYLQELRKQKIRVSVMGDAREAPAVFHAASLSIVADSCRSALKRDVKDVRAVADGGCSAGRRRADALIPRDTVSAGGLYSYLTGLLCCRSAERKKEAIFRFLILSHLTRFAFCLLSVCFGVPLFSGAQMLYSGLLAEIVFVVFLSLMHIQPPSLRTADLLNEKKIVKILSDPAAWLPDVSCAVLSVLYVFVLRMCGLIEKDGQVSFLFCAAAVLQMIAFYRSAVLLNRKQAKAYAWLPQALLSIPILCGSLLCLLFPSLHAMLSLGGFRPTTVLALSVIPFLLYLLRKLFLFFFHRTAK